MIDFGLVIASHNAANRPIGLGGVASCKVLLEEEDGSVFFLVVVVVGDALWCKVLVRKKVYRGDT